MCLTCLSQYTDSPRVTEETKKAAYLISRVYEFNCVGGNAHTVIDDWNIGDEDIDRCISFEIPENHHHAWPEQIAAEIECLEFMRGLSIEDRASALAIHCGYFEEK